MKRTISTSGFLSSCTKNKSTPSLIQDLRLPAHRKRQAGFVRCRWQLGDDRLRRGWPDLNHWNSCRRLHKNTNSNNLILNKTPKYNYFVVILLKCSFMAIFEITAEKYLKLFLKSIAAHFAKFQCSRLICS